MQEAISSRRTLELRLVADLPVHSAKLEGDLAFRAVRVEFDAEEAAHHAMKLVVGLVLAGGAAGV